MKRLIKKHNAKQVGPLYHFTGLENLYGILTENALIGDTYESVSFTRNKNFNSQERTLGADMECRIEIDGDQLSNNYKIEPFSDNCFFENAFENTYNRKPNATDLEQEERVKGTISPIIPYITKIAILSNNISSRTERKFKKILSIDNIAISNIQEFFNQFGVLIEIE